MDSDEDDMESLGKQSSGMHIRTHSSEEDVSEKELLDIEGVLVDDHASKIVNVMKQVTCLPLESPKKSRLSRSFSRKLSTLRIPKKDDMVMTDNQADEAVFNVFTSETISDGYEAAEDSFGPHLIHAQSEHDMSDDEENEPKLEDSVPKKSILQRIDSHKGTKSFQLGRQLSCKWSTGAGPRIGCLRDYPTELQSHALEQENLSPRSAPCNFKYTNKSFFSRDSGPYRTSSSPSQIGHDFTEIFD